MNIKHAQEKTGISKQNIRYYEKQGLLSPSRNEENDYRDYSEEDIRRLCMIRMLRMLDMPLVRIRQVLEGEVSLQEAADCQKQELLCQKEKLQGLGCSAGRLGLDGGVGYSVDPVVLEYGRKSEE